MCVILLHTNSVKSTDEARRWRYREAGEREFRKIKQRRRETKRQTQTIGVCVWFGESFLHGRSEYTLCQLPTQNTQRPPTPAHPTHSTHYLFFSSSPVSPTLVFSLPLSSLPPSASPTCQLSSVAPLVDDT